MLKSMTGYGFAELQDEADSLSVEIRTVNHKFSEFIFRMPRNFYPLEQEIRNLIAEKVSRGHIEVSIQKNGKDTDEGIPTFHPGVVSQYYDLLKRVADLCDLKEPIRLSHLLTFRDLFFAQQSTSLTDADIARFRSVLHMAIDRLEAMRMQEGQNIYEDFVQRQMKLQCYLQEIEAKHPEAIQNFTERLKMKILEISNLPQIDESRWALEIAVIAERYDITEELVRLKSHLEQFSEILHLSEPNGKRLEFITQEMARELNTIGSKSNHSTISKIVVEAKNEIARIREQLQNVE